MITDEPSSLTLDINAVYHDEVYKSNLDFWTLMNIIINAIGFD